MGQEKSSVHNDIKHLLYENNFKRFDTIILLTLQPKPYTKTKLFCKYSCYRKKTFCTRKVKNINFSLTK